MDPLISGILGIKQAQTAAKIQVAVAKKVLDNDKMQGAAALKLLDAAAGGVNKAGDGVGWRTRYLRIGHGDSI